MSSQTITVPDIGGAEGVEVIEVCVAIGDVVEQEQSLIVLETDKASMEVPCTAAGKITALSIEVGHKVNEGDTICVVETEAAGQPAPSAPAAAEPAPQSPAPAAAPAAAAQAVVPEGVEDAEVIEVSIQVGSDISEGDTVAVLETDKATVDVPATASGKVVSVAISVGDKLSSGDVVAELAGAGGAASAPTPAVEPPAPVAAASAAPVAQATAKKTASVPEGAEDVEVIEISVKIGDVIAEGDSLAVLETDKATVDVPANAAGEVTAILIEVGQKVSTGDLVVELEGAADASVAPVAAPPAAAPAVATKQIATVPEGAEDVEVIEISVAVGDTIAEGDGLAVLETDKATVDVPANASGKVTAILIKVGQKVSTGDPVVELESSAAAAPVSAPAQAAAAAAPPAAAAVQAAPVADAPANVNTKATDVYAGPAVRTHARLLGVDLGDIKATGPRGRILKEDVDDYVKQIVKQQKAAPKASSTVTGGAGIPPVPAVDFSKFGEIETKAMSKIQKLTALNMHRNWLNIPAVTQFDDADISDLEAFRKGLKAEAEKRGVKLTPLPFLLKAVAAALKYEPKFNSSLNADGDAIIYKKYCNIGIAADTPMGLLVPVVRDVDKKGLWELAEEANSIIKKARDGKLKPAEMQGGCFTISSLGAMGGKGFTPIVNAPEVAILGVSKAEMKPVWNGKEFMPRNMLPLCLSYDHRVINGADCGRFFTYLVAVLSDVRRILL